MIQTQIKTTKYVHLLNSSMPAFNKLHAHGHSGLKISIKAFNQFCFTRFVIKMDVDIYS